jgi:hypothetical protein
LHIEKVFRCKNDRLDGVLNLGSGENVAIEIKLMMNWAKACQSGYQFTRFLERHQGNELSVRAGIVFFRDFSGDWAKRTGPAQMERGWTAWYLNHHQTLDRAFHLVRLRDGKIESYPG